MFAVSPWPAVTALPASTPKSLTGAERWEKVGAGFGGESAQKVRKAPPEQSTAAPGSPALLSERKATTPLQRNGLTNAAPASPAGRVNSGWNAVSRVEASAGLKVFAVER